MSVWSTVPFASVTVRVFDVSKPSSGYSATVVWPGLSVLMLYCTAPVVALTMFALKSAENETVRFIGMLHSSMVTVLLDPLVE